MKRTELLNMHRDAGWISLGFDECAVFVTEGRLRQKQETILLNKKLTKPDRRVLDAMISFVILSSQPKPSKKEKKS